MCAATGHLLPLCTASRAREVGYDARGPNRGQQAASTRQSAPRLPPLDNVTQVASTGFGGGVQPRPALSPRCCPCTLLPSTVPNTDILQRPRAPCSAQRIPSVHKVVAAAECSSTRQAQPVMSNPAKDKATSGRRTGGGGSSGGGGSESKRESMRTAADVLNRLRCASRLSPCSALRPRSGRHDVVTPRVDSVHRAPRQPRVA